MRAPPGWHETAPGLTVPRNGSRAVADWFGEDAGQAVAGGRGTTRRIETARGGVFVRRYLHGGLLGGFLGSLYGPGTPRPMREIRALERVRAAGVLAPEPLAARVVGVGPRIGPWQWHRALLVTRAIEGRRPLADALRAAEAETRLGWIDAVSDAVRAIHAAGVHHPDLNIGNFLAGGAPADGLAVLDFDRARIQRGPCGWIVRWLARRRLSRSVAGLGLSGLAQPVVRARLAQRLGRQTALVDRYGDSVDRALAAAFDGALAADVEILKSSPRRATVRVGFGGGSVVVKAVRRHWLWLRLLGPLGLTPAGRRVRAARALSGRGIRVPEPLARREVTRPGLPEASCVIASDLGAGEALFTWAQRADRLARYRLAGSLGKFVGGMHRAGAWVADLKHDNLLVENGRFAVTDLDRVRFWRGAVPLRRALRNLVQLEWRLGWDASPRERLAFLSAWRRASGCALEVREVLRQFRSIRRRERARIVERRGGRRLDDPADRPPVSAIVICGNEADHIEACLESVAWCDEIIVVDSFSTDGTFELAAPRATCLVRHPWSGYVAQKRYALSLANHPWVLNIDADERVSPELRLRLERLLADDGAGCDAFAVPRLVHYLGRWWTVGGWYPGRRLRFFRREAATWGGLDPHEHVVVDGVVGRLSEPFWHFTYDDVADHVRQMNRLTDWARGGKPPTLSQLVLRPLFRVVRSFFWRGGFRFGFVGLYVAVSSGLYAHLKYAKRGETAVAVAVES